MRLSCRRPEARLAGSPGKDRVGHIAFATMRYVHLSDADVLAAITSAEEAAGGDERALAELTPKVYRGPPHHQHQSDEAWGTNLRSYRSLRFP